MHAVQSFFVEGQTVLHSLLSKTMNFVDLITNPGLHTINSKILNTLSYRDLKNCRQVSKKIAHYIKNYCEKWRLLEEIQAKKYVKKEEGEWTEDLDIWVPIVFPLERTIIQLFTPEVFEYFEEHGNIKQLAVFLDFIQAFLDDKETHFNSHPVQFAAERKRTDFVNLLVPTPLDYCWDIILAYCKLQDVVKNRLERD